jgi:hypothetical protein
MKNTIISIGFTGLMRCYLNVPLEEAKKRYMKEERISEEEFESSVTIEQIEFTDEFGTYSIWE